jgi:NADPH:quinone reductase-like Zn-dependent oxidoreductase
MPQQASEPVSGTDVASRPPPQTMRALLQDRYGSPDVLQIAHIPKPTPGPGEVVVQVKASSVNARDWHLMRGEPKLARLLDRSTFERSAPKVKVRGTDFAGVVESVGADVSRWRPGDAVFGEADAAIAEYVLASQDLMAAVPQWLTFEQAAAMPLAANTALVCLRAGNARAGQHILINGASGGVGTFAVQLATSMGLHVTAVCSARNVDLLRSLGAETVIDYQREDFSSGEKRFDVVVDLVGNRTLRDLLRVVSPTGTLVLSGGGVSGQGRIVGPLALLVRAQAAARLRHRRVRTPAATPSRENLEKLAELAGTGAFTPVVERTYPFEAAAAAIRYLETEHARAKVVITHGST